jgi:hypothetical protein
MTWQHPRGSLWSMDICFPAETSESSEDCDGIQQSSDLRSLRCSPPGPRKPDNAPGRSPPELSRQSHDNLFAVGGALAVPSTSLWMRLPMRQ